MHAVIKVNPSQQKGPLVLLLATLQADTATMNSNTAKRANQIMLMRLHNWYSRVLSIGSILWCCVYNYSDWDRTWIRVCAHKRQPISGHHRGWAIGSQSNKTSYLLTITVMSQWTPWRLKSTAFGFFAQPFVQAHIKENFKAQRHWSLWGESTGDRWIPPINDL